MTMSLVSHYVDTSPQEPTALERPKRLPVLGLASTPEHRAARYLRTVEPVADVLAVVRRRSGLSMADLSGRDRHQRIAFYRHVAAWLMREYGLSLPEIGRELGKRDHTTVMNSVRQITSAREKMPEVRELTDAMLVELGLLAATRPPPRTDLPLIPDLIPPRAALAEGPE